MEYTKEQVKAAYALNLCTISISQIIDYNDVNIMEQEYDAILNNLNLEQIPKDEALLKILKQTLDTITFFRISEKEREFIEKGYQMKMKNAIWSAVPNIGMIFSGGNWVTAAITIASQVGIGYMNYRRAKASGEFEKEKQLWELERSAIEQFNGLRRELFDTAWRLSAAYNYPDELRLTERQIKQYNNILMDDDPVRRYERLDSIKEYFIAYPPFWYYMGHTAIDISRADIFIPDVKREKFRQEAIEHFIKFRSTNQQGLLREDPIASACALELIDLLDPVKDRDLISELIREAYGFSGRKEDVLQICAMDYLRIGENEKAVHILKQLLNEEYIPYMNAQLLSGLYVSSYINNQSLDILGDYILLQKRVGPQYLVPLPTADLKKEDLGQAFVEQQQKMLVEKYYTTIKEIHDRYAGYYAKIIPIDIRHKNEKFIDYYALSKEEMSEIFIQLKSTFDNSSDAERYKNILKEIDIKTSITDLLNDLFITIREFIFVDDALQSYLANDVEKAIIDHRDDLNNLLFKLNKGKFEYSDMIALLNIDYTDFTDAFFNDLNKGMVAYVKSLHEMQDFAIAEQNLVEFCNKHGLQDPDVKYAENHTMRYDVITTDRKFTSDLWEQKEARYNEEAKKKLSLLKTVVKYQGSIITNPDHAEFYSSKDPRTSRYFSTNGKLYNYKGLKQKTIAVLDARGKNGGFDLIFTDEGIVPYRDDVIKRQVLYKDIHWNDKEHKELYIGEPYKGYVADLDAMYNMIQELKKNSTIPVEQGVNIWDAILGAIGLKK